LKKILFISGGSRGIGAATAKACAADFDHLIITYHCQRDAALTLAQSLKVSGELLALPMDVSDEDSVRQAFQHVDNIEGMLTGLVNCAGIVAPATTLVGIGKERLYKLFATNVFGTVYCCQQALQRMDAGGSIVNIGSIASKYGSPGEYIDYAASKGAIDTFTLGLAKEVASQNIRVNCVRPGIIDTDIHADSGDRDRPQKLASQIPLQRPGLAEEVADAVRWLLSEKASYTTGSFIDVAGGR